MVSEINSAEIKFETADFTLTAGFDYEFDDDTANLELMFDGIHLDDKTENLVTSLLKNTFSNQTDVSTDHDEEGEDSTYTRIEVMLDTSECNKSMLNYSLLSLVTSFLQLWTGKMTIETK